jgi:peptide/nickel transport system substrate-binding protein
MSKTRQGKPVDRPGGLTRATGWTVVALALLPWTGCTGKPPEPLRIAHSSAIPPSLDPNLASADGAVHSLYANFYEGLASLDREMHVRPALGVSWTTPEDRTWVLELRKGVRFHDGTLLTAAIARECLERARTGSGSTLARELSTVERIDVVDEGHLRIRTRGPDEFLMNRLAVVPIGRSAPGEGGTPRFVGTGPYEAEGFRQGAIVARAFAGYWGKAAEIPEVLFVSVTSPEGLSLFEAGGLDVLRLSEGLERVARVPGARVVSRPSTAATYLCYDSRPAPRGSTNPFSDKRVREAVALSIDRKALARARGSVPLSQLVPDGIYGHLAEVPELGYDPERARALLRSAGYPRGLHAGALVYYPAVAVTTALAEAVRSSLEGVGIHVRLETTEWQALNEGWSLGRLPLFLGTWFFESGDASGFFVDCIETRDPVRHRGAYNPGFSSPRLDSLIEEPSGSPEERLERYRKIAIESLGEVPLVPLMSPGITYALSRRVRFDPRLDGELRAYEMGVAR